MKLSYKKAVISGYIIGTYLTILYAVIFQRSDILTLAAGIPFIILLSLVVFGLVPAMIIWLVTDDGLRPSKDES